MFLEIILFFNFISNRNLEWFTLRLVTCIELTYLVILKYKTQAVKTNPTCRPNDVIIQKLN